MYSNRKLEYVTENRNDRFCNADVTVLDGARASGKRTECEWALSHVTFMAAAMPVMF